MQFDTSQNNSADATTTSPGRSEKTTRDVTFKAAKRGRSSCQTFEGLGVFQCVEIKCWTIQLLYGLKLPSFRCLDKIHGICNYILDCDLVCWSFLVHWSSSISLCNIAHLMGFFGRQHCCRCTDIWGAPSDIIARLKGVGVGAGHQHGHDDQCHWGQQWHFQFE